MTRRTEVVKLEEGFVVKAWAKTEAEAARLQFALVGVPPDKAFMPEAGTNLPNAGIPFDPPEEPAWPSDATAEWRGPLNCDGAGHYIAGAQLEDALSNDGDGCGVGLCVKRDEA